MGEKNMLTIVLNKTF